MLLLGPMLTLASAAIVTEIPPFLRGDIQIAYSYEQLSGKLQERGDEELEVGQRTLSDHRLQYGLVFSVAPGVAVFADLPHYVSSRVSYGALSDMVYDPGTGSGTYVGTTEGTPGTYVDGAGLGGLWMGVRGTPFSEAFQKRNSSTTWLIEGAFRTGDKTSFWTADEDGKRGAGPGGTAARLHTAFSTTFGNTSPYVAGTYVGEGKQTVDVVTPDGTTHAQVEVDPANHGDMRIGMEVLTGQNPASGSQFVFDMHLDVSYDAYALLPSGFYLPNTLDASAGGLVQQAEQLEAGGGIGLHWRPFQNLQIGVNADLAYHMPQRIEYPYPVYTGGDTIRFAAGTTLGVRFR
ncbi:MAG: hypothetical protein Q8P41_01265 [Pseudomonadota bacterium]|nr:hypothetical protein [Pseudomonadota bacterium]